MESPDQEKIVGRLCAIGRAEHTNLIGGAGYKFIENGGFKWELDAIDLDRYGITMDALLDCVEQLEKMGDISKVKGSEHFREIEGWKNTGLVIQSKADPRIACAVTLVGNEYDPTDVIIRWFVDLEKESKSAKGPAERAVDPEELKAVERAQEMSKEQKSDKKKEESIDQLFEMPILGESNSRKVSVIGEDFDGWGLPSLSEEELKHVGVDALKKPEKKMPGKDTDEKDLADKEVKPGEPEDKPKHVEGDGKAAKADPVSQSDLPDSKVKPGEPGANPKHVAESQRRLHQEARPAPKHPALRKTHAKVAETGLESDNEGHIYQTEKKLKETGEPDQDYDHAFYDKICDALKAEGMKDAGHREFDKYQGIYLTVQDEDGKFHKFWEIASDQMNDGDILSCWTPDGKDESICVVVTKSGAAVGDLVEYIKTGKNPANESVKVGMHKGTEQNSKAPGLHLVSLGAIGEAKSYAAAKGISRIYIHRDGLKLEGKDETRNYIVRHGVMKFVEDNEMHVGVDALEKPKSEIGDKDRKEVDGEKKVDVKPGEPEKKPETMAGKGGEVGGSDKEGDVAAAKVKPSEPGKSPKLMAERKKLREMAMKRRDEKKRGLREGVSRKSAASLREEAQKKNLKTEGRKSPGQYALTEGVKIDHPQKVILGMKRSMDEAYRAVRKAHETLEAAQHHAKACESQIPAQIGEALAPHHSTIDQAKQKVQEAKRMMMDVCESVDQASRQMRRK